MAGLQWKTAERDLYGSGTSPVELTVPEMGFFVVSGEGSPDGLAFQAAVECLYTLSYGARMSYKKDWKPTGWFEYTVYPLEGVWDLIDRTAHVPGISPSKDNLKWDVMIRQPDFVDQAFADFLREELARSKKNPSLLGASYVRAAEGRCVQILHKGPFETEPASFRAMADWCRKESLARQSMLHREIYLSDPRKSAPDKLRTLLRIQVRDDFSCI